MPQTGKLLLSEPFMFDENFRRSVVLLCEAQDDGAFGLMLNKPLGLMLSQVMETPFDHFDVELFYGGPVEPDTLHFVHNAGELIKGSIEIAPYLFWGGDFEMMRTMIVAGEIKPRDVRFFLGYSGWGPEQLRLEMEEHSWIIAQSHADHIFSDTPEDLWRNVLKSLGGEYKRMANYPEDPQLN